MSKPVLTRTINWGDKIAISIASGKGGVGKSSFAGNLGTAFTKIGKKVVLIDADLGAANLHTMVGVSYPEKTLSDFIKKRYNSLEDVLIDTPYKNLRLLSSASDILSLSSPTYKERQRLISQIRNLDTDVIIFDIAAGAHRRAIDFFTLAPLGIIIIQPVLTSLENAYTFLKNLLVRHLLRIFYKNREIRAIISRATDHHDSQYTMELGELIEKLELEAPDKVNAFKQEFIELGKKFCIILNGVKENRQVAVAEKFARITKRYLGLPVSVLGYLPFEFNLDKSIIERKPFIIKYPSSNYSKEIMQLPEKILFTANSMDTL